MAAKCYFMKKQNNFKQGVRKTNIFTRALSVYCFKPKCQDFPFLLQRLEAECLNGVVTA